jgi:hypothetical protein
MITGAQITASRALLGWSMRDLARHAALEIADVQEAETLVKMPKRRLTNIAAIQHALQAAGIEFIDSVGVQLLPAELKVANRVIDQSPTVMIAGAEFPAYRS